MTSIVQPLSSARFQAEPFTSYRADIDGLRAFAVLAVIFCHAGFTWSAGGFIGVDVFFTISGFVVTHSILRDLKQDCFSLSRFYARRARRLGPALYLVMAVTFFFSLLFCLPENTFRLAKNILAVATLTSNIYLSKQTGYFDAASLDQPLLHTWSLSVEEQFYLALPLVLLWCRHRSHAAKLAVLAVFAVASFAAAMIASSTYAGSAYYFSQNRAFEFLIGVMLAVWETKRRARPSAIFDCLYAASLVCLVCGVTPFGQASVFSGVSALLPCLAAALAIYAARRARIMQHLLANAFAASIGRISYPAYLWHWPIFFAFRRLGLSGSDNVVMAIALTFLLATLTFFFIERKAQDGPLDARRALVTYIAIPLLGAAILAGVGRITDGFLFAYPAAIRENVHWSGPGLTDTPHADACGSKVSVTDEKTCTVGDLASPKRAILWGDSHAYHMVHFFELLGIDRKMAIHDVAFSGCPPVASMPARPGDPKFTASHGECLQHNREVMQHILARDDIKTVFMSSAWQKYQNPDASPHAEPNWMGFLHGELEQRLVATIGQLVAAGKHVVMLDDLPELPKSLVNCAFYNGLWFPVGHRECRFGKQIADIQYAQIEAMQSRLKSRFPTIDILHTFDVPCSDGQCVLDFDGRPIYRYNDDNHLGLAGALFYYDHYRKKHPDELDEILGAR